MKIGIVAFSFGFREGEEPSKCNRRIAMEVARIYGEEKRMGNQIVVVAQWEVALALLSLKVPVIKAVERNEDHPSIYLDSEEVMRQAAEIFKRSGVSHVIPVAQPFLHLSKCRKLVRCYPPLLLLRRHVGWIGFDPLSGHPWTRSRTRLLMYAIRQKLFAHKGR